MHTCLNIYFACLSVRLYPISVKTAEPIGPNFFVGPRVTPREGLWIIEFSKLSSNKIQFSKFWKSTKFFYFCFTTYMKRKCSQLKWKLSAKRSLVIIYTCNTKSRKGSILNLIWLINHRTRLYMQDYTDILHTFLFKNTRIQEEPKHMRITSQKLSELTLFESDGIFHIFDQIRVSRVPL